MNQSICIFIYLLIDFLHTAFIVITVLFCFVCSLKKTISLFFYYFFIIIFIWLQLGSNPEPLSSKTQPVWRNGWVFVYELSVSGFEFSCSHLNFGFRACFEQGVLWHSGNYRVWIHSEKRTWHDRNMQSIFYLII